jgi:dTDP-4-dehydrorhamnose reductase
MRMGAQVGTLVIVGAGGVLGTKLVEQSLALGDAPYERVVAYAHRLPAPERRVGGDQVTWAALDIGEAAAVATALAAARPAAVINAAAMTNVDACEDRPDEALAANGAGPGHLAAACVWLGAPLLHVSTDYVFPGTDAAPGPYVEGAAVGPVNHYGRTKLEGERAVEAVCAGRVPWLVARTALVYGHIPGGRGNFVSWLAGELRAGRRVRVVDDQWNTPTLADDLAAALLRLLARGAEGIIHVAGPDLLTRDAWARQIAAYYGLDAGLIDVTSSAALAQRAQRPLRSGLRTERAAELDGVALRGVRAGLAALGPP